MFVDCSCGRRHWGHRGAAGLLLTDPARTGVVLQQRSARVHQGNTWALMGGAIERGEDAATAALREAHEESGVDAGEITVLRTVLGLQHPEWSYTYVLAETERPEHPDLPGGRSWEADRTAWIDLEAVSAFTLHPVLVGDWPRLRTLLTSDGEPTSGL
ncbi:MAG: hydrolase [Marmoricola sp.]|nr:hydrolase [Marmoricola sp.]